MAHKYCPEDTLLQDIFSLIPLKLSSLIVNVSCRFLKKNIIEVSAPVDIPYNIISFFDKSHSQYLTLVSLANLVSFIYPLNLISGILVN